MVFLLLLCLGKIHVIKNICKLPIRKLTKKHHYNLIDVNLIFRKILTSNTNFCIHFFLIIKYVYYYFSIIVITILFIIVIIIISPL